MKLIDTHCHLCHGRLRNQLAEVLTRAEQADVTTMICAAADVAESQAAASLARRNEKIYSLAGIHPHDAKNASPEDLLRIEQLAGQARTVAVGEIGLDYHYNYSPPADQRRLFAEQLEWAVQQGCKIVIHTREAFDETMHLLAEAGADGAKVLFHSWTAGVQELRRVLDFGATVSFSGIVTFAKAVQLREAARLVPADRLLLETDAPFLSPAPVRKIQTNEPAHLIHIAECLAAVRGIAVEKLAEQTTANAVAFFGLTL